MPTSRYATMLGLLLLLAPGASLALDLAGFTIGRTISAADKARFANRPNGQVSVCTDTLCGGTLKLGEILASVGVHFTERGRITSVSVRVAWGEHVSILEAALNKYGKPMINKDSVTRSLTGEALSNMTLAWEFKDGTVMFEERCSVHPEFSCLVANDTKLSGAIPKAKL